MVQISRGIRLRGARSACQKGIVPMLHLLYVYNRKGIYKYSRQVNVAMVWAPHMVVVDRL